MTDEFTPVSSIADRNTFLCIWNYYVSKRNMLAKQKADKAKITEIDNYLNQLNNRDKEIKRDNAIKRHAEKKRIKTEEQNKITKMIETVTKQLEEHAHKKEGINREMQVLEKEIKEKQALMAEYARQIGLTILQEKYNELRIEFNKKPITSCRHLDLDYEGCLHKCTLCGKVGETHDF